MYGVAKIRWLWLWLQSALPLAMKGGHVLCGEFSPPELHQV